MADRSYMLRKLSAGFPGDVSERQEAVARHLRENARGVVVERTQLSHNNLVELFMQEAALCDADCRELPSLQAVPQAVADIVAERRLAPHLWVSEQKEVAELSWDVGDLQVVGSDGFRDGLVGVNMAFGGVAETGSLAFVSAADLALSQNFLCAYHVVILRRSDIVAGYEDIRARLGDDFTNHRGFIFVTGPSRTGDIAQTLELGAHGALSVDILIVGDG